MISFSVTVEVLEHITVSQPLHVHHYNSIKVEYPCEKHGYSTLYVQRLYNEDIVYNFRAQLHGTGSSRKCCVRNFSKSIYCKVFR